MSEIESRASRSVCHVFHHLINPFSTFLNYKLLEHLISKFGTKKLQQKMTCYVADASKFKHETTVAELIDHWDGIENQFNYIELKVHFGEDPMKCTLEKLDKYRKKFCSRYKLTELVMILIHLKPGSFIAVWRIPTLLGSELMGSTSLKHKYDDILSLSLAGKRADISTNFRTMVWIHSKGKEPCMHAHYNYNTPRPSICK